ncbi:DinB family protein [Deinococcus aquaticus]|uniref:DinB family protein n=1 Tax=Deinococcus aquaticus TaxID=328692 RepID=A0ABY7V440_9DEIO|nr:DinB family protein [Deinococcus aquaticus]WDA59969.1 DinB family protein [Deinococcus aquaticus]
MSTPVGAVTAFLAEQFRSELEMFRAALDSAQGDAFHTSRLGHSPAWHALHVAEWMRLMILDDRTPNYHHLGWEDNARVQALGTQPAPFTETDPCEQIMAALDDTGAQVIAWLEQADDSALDGEVFSAATPGGTRPRRAAMGMQLRHIGYHRGQLNLLLKS